jgi:hypothetical protein
MNNWTSRGPLVDQDINKSPEGYEIAVGDLFDDGHGTKMLITNLTIDKVEFIWHTISNKELSYRETHYCDRSKFWTMANSSGQKPPVKFVDGLRIGKPIC